MTDAYQNAAFIPDGMAYPARWAAAAAAFRAAHPPETIPYGPTDRQAMDLFRPTNPKGLLVFIHGGYWKQFHRHDWSHLAAGALARGWAVAMPSYDLCPDVRIADITVQMRAALTSAMAQVDGPTVLTGHSAGGHLTARLAATPRLVRAVPISPLSNLAPLMATDMNATLRIDVPEAAAESPVLHPKPMTPVHVWVGADERPAFLEQARWLSAAWTAPLTVAAGQHHFNVIDGLADPDSPLMTALLEGLP
jgi:arylformamidase